MKVEEYLEEQCFKQNPQVLDDGMPDFFNAWIQRLDKGDLMEYIVEYDNLTGGAEIINAQGFIEKSVIPMGVSAWKEYGIKFGYWDYFKKNG